MRKITQQAIQAFMSGIAFSKGNTRCERNWQGYMVLQLHGNTIARLNTHTGELFITDADWPTTTTKERLNGLPGVQVYTSKKQLHLNGKPWSGAWTAINSFAGPVPSSMLGNDRSANLPEIA